jgi:hypothetical protein
MQKDRSYLLLLFIMFICCSCLKEQSYTAGHKKIESVFGVDFNKARAKVGLSELNSNWIILEIIGDSCIWWTDSAIDKNDLNVKPYYFDKRTMIIDDTLVFESDIYTNPEIAFGNLHVNLSYIYYFKPDRGQKVGWAYFFLSKHDDPDDGFITKQKADSILQSWGLKHPY